jgi:NADH:ubiquinone oxidoreductase subunit F (NADH-binding)/NADH:ubiquinone oxidoreductase subunit E
VTSPIRPRRQAVVELEHRFHRGATEVLERLRRAKAERGRIAPEDLDRIAAELGLPRAHVGGAASFYADLGFAPRSGRVVRVCHGASCFGATGGRHVRTVDAAVRNGAQRGSVERVYCLGYCYASPAALDGETPHAGPKLVEQLAGRAPRSDPPIPFAAATDDPVVLARLVHSGPAPWGVWRQLVTEPQAGERVLAETARSGLRGRGGAGFPVARKWELARAAAGEGPRYVVANGDEGDPGSYADRLLMERDPHGVLEGVALAALAAGADHGYVYVRSEYPAARDALRAAVLEARAAGHLGSDIRGSGVNFDVEIFEGAGSYVAGEETALLHSMEGLRGAAAARPPFPAGRGGLYGVPTVVNNVETLSALQWILDRGGNAYAARGAEDSHGTKLVCLNAAFARPGVYEVEFGTRLERICSELGGGLRDGRRLRALQVGGPLGGFLAAGELDVPLSIGALAERGVALGHGSLVAFDERISGRELLLHTWRFADAENCGTCSPCRIGSRRGLEIAERIAAGRPEHDDDARMSALLQTMEDASLCGFGQGVPAPVRGIARIYAGELGLQR